MSDPADQWQVARRRKGTARKSKVSHVSEGPTCSRDELDIGKTVKRIRDTVSELRCEAFWQEWREHFSVARSAVLLKPPGKTEIEDPAEHLRSADDGGPGQQMDCVCFGLGSFSSCVSARFQLAMLLLLLESGRIPLKNCSLYDPAFSSGEKDVLRELGLKVLIENEEGKHLAAKPTLFYLMHCGKALYNNLLWKNWSPESLPWMIIIGNSFSGMKDRSIDREFNRDYSYISEAVSVSEETLLPCPSHMVDVFSDTAIITFPHTGLDKLQHSTWAEPPEPQYQHCSDLEIIRKKTPS